MKSAPPRGRWWREVHMIVRPPRQPILDCGGFVSGVIVHNNVNVETVGNLRIDLLKKIEKLRGSMALVALRKISVRRDIESYESFVIQRGGLILEEVADVDERKSCSI
jgi:hypothetical protein